MTPRSASTLWPRSMEWVAVCAAVLAMLATACTGTPRPSAPRPSTLTGAADGRPRPGSEPAGDVLFPGLGNGGYDHPTGKARYTFHLTVPTGYTAVANGRGAGVSRRGSWTTWSYEDPDPTATYLVQVSVGRYVVRSSRGPHGITVRNVFPAGAQGT